jgi:hypothetical protein
VRPESDINELTHLVTVVNDQNNDTRAVKRAVIPIRFLRVNLSLRFDVVRGSAVD